MMTTKVKFDVISHSHNARAGLLTVNQRQLTTPLLVQTGIVEASLTSDELQALGVTAIKQSALPYWLASGEGSQPDFGDLHRRLNWPGLIVGVPGTEQAYRWAKPRGRKKDGVSFHAPRTNQQKRYTPQEAFEWQAKLGCDIRTSFSRWEDYYAPVDDLRAAGQQTAAWLPEPWPTATLAAVAGGGLKRVRQAGVQAATAKDPLGYCIAGVDPNVKLAEQVRLVSTVAAMLPTKGLRYLPTVGSIEQTLLTLLAGIDVVDSDCAGQAAQHGVAFIGTKRLSLVKEHLISDQRPLMAGCRCPTCQSYSRSYLHQLIIDHQPLGIRLLLIHNLFVLNHLVSDLRQAIVADRVAEWTADQSLGEWQWLF